MKNVEYNGKRFNDDYVITIDDNRPGSGRKIMSYLTLYVIGNSFSRNQWHDVIGEHVNVRTCSHNTWACAIFVTRQWDQCENFVVSRPIDCSGFHRTMG